jgi:hypothetical protein
MARVISVHSYRGGTGKSNTTANCAALMAAQGLKVGVVDTDIPSPGIHVIFNLEPEDMGYTLNDFLWGKCQIREAAHDVTAKLGAAVRGQVYLVPSSIRASDIARIVREGYDVNLLNDGFNALLDELQLDVLLIDTAHALCVGRRVRCGAHVAPRPCRGRRQSPRRAVAAAAEARRHRGAGLRRAPALHAPQGDAPAGRGACPALEPGA